MENERKSRVREMDMCGVSEFQLGVFKAGVDSCGPFPCLIHFEKGVQRGCWASKPWHHVAVEVDESKKLAQCVRVGRSGPISNELESVM